VIAEEAIRYLAYEAECCRKLAYANRDGDKENLTYQRDKLEAFTLLLPTMMRLLCLPTMDSFEAADFAVQIRDELDLQIIPEAITTS
jgi:hypothetical protein